jgi:hypothetical protein
VGYTDWWVLTTVYTSVGGKFIAANISNVYATLDTFTFALYLVTLGPRDDCRPNMFLFIYNKELCPSSGGINRLMMAL